jgi:ubiquinone/menaquinone biosynthesis C-methylase UbiE
VADQNTSRSADVAAEYDRAARTLPEFTVLNYGYWSAGETTVLGEDEPERYCLRLYEHTVRDVDLTGKEVLEVSCGRGGGGAFLMKSRGIRRYVGVDLSEENIRLARSRTDGPEYRIGYAEHLEFDDASFDCVINIEASHLYDDRLSFFKEAFRVLRPGGHFCYADGFWANDDCTAELETAGFELLVRREITENVVQACERDNDRRSALFDALADTDEIDRYKDWGGVVGYRAYRRFTARETLYFSHLLRKR